MRSIALMLAAAAVCFTSQIPAQAAAPQRAQPLTADGLLRWIGDYRFKPDPMRVPEIIRALSQSGSFKEPENAAVHIGFFAGVIARSDKPEELIKKTLPLPYEDQWVLIKAIAYSGHSQWKALLRKYAMYMPGRQAMVQKFLNDKLPTLDQIAFDRPLAWQEKLKVYFTGKDPDKGKLRLEPTPELVDMLWGYYFATGAYRPVAQIVGMLRWSKEKNSVDKLTVGSMAKYTLATNAARDGDLLKILRWQYKQIQNDDKPILKEVIDAAETVDTVKLRKMALAAIEERKIKGPGYKENINTWGQVGQAAIGLGCIAAAAAGAVALGLPCVIGGAASTAALNAWAKQ
ncbi:MAG TPA: hypothetical protein VNQ34_03270 [Xanthobacteraceae bacterium]|nr:hypothetical protein [Xanthobacteraceae bacterium]